MMAGTARTKTDFFIVRSLAMTNYLVRSGYDIQKVEDSIDDPKFKLFLFEKTPEFEMSVSVFLSRRKGA